MTLLETFLYFMAAHALCDFPLQGDYLAKGKDHTNPANDSIWQTCLTSHCFIHSGAVLLVTGRIELAVAELVVHWVIDHAKCSKAFGFIADQALHVLCKVAYVAWIGLAV